MIGKNGRVLGASILGAGAGDLILPWALAISQKLKIGALANLIVPYPTRGEASKRAAGSFYTPTLFSARTRGLVRLLARFGCRELDVLLQSLSARLLVLTIFFVM